MRSSFYMKISIILNTNEAEVVWNAFRFASTSLKANHKVEVFLINKDVEVEDIKYEKYDIREQIYACG